MAEKTTYARILKRAANHAGLDRDDVDTQTQAAVNEAVNEMLREVWEAWRWPELMNVERRQFRQDWSSITTYAAGDEVYHPASDAYYQALRASTDEEPADATDTVNYAYWYPLQADYSGPEYEAATYAVGDVVQRPSDGEYYACHTAHTGTATFDTTKFGILTAFVRNIAREQSWESANLGTVLDVWDHDPRTHRGQGPREFFEYSDGIVIPEGPNRVWVEWRDRVHDLTGSDYSETATYASGDIVYYSTNGDWYEASASTSIGEDPNDTPAKWTRLQIPRRFLEPLAFYAAAVIRRRGGKAEDGDALEARARGWLVQTIDVLERQQRQTGHMRVRTPRPVTLY